MATRFLRWRRWHHNIVLVCIIILCYCLFKSKLTRRLLCYYNTLYLYTASRYNTREIVRGLYNMEVPIVIYFICNILQQCCDVRIRYVRSNARVVSIHLTIYTYIYYILFFSLMEQAVKYYYYYYYILYILFIIHV